jgi:hypothetical protein
MTHAVNSAAFAVLWQSALPIDRVAAEVGVCRRTAYNLAARLDLPPRDPVKRALRDGIAPGAITLARVSCLSRRPL